MSQNIDQHFVRQYADNIMLLLEQKETKLRPFVTVENDIKGVQKSVDRIGNVEAQVIDGRHGETPINDTPQDRRWYTLRGYETGDQIDDIDVVRTLNDPTNSYVVKHAHAMARAIDRSVIMPAFFGDVTTGVHAGGGTTSFPASQQIAVNFVESGSTQNSDLTVGKLRQAHELLSAAEVPIDDGEIYIAVTSAQVHSLLQQPELTNADFTAVRALQTGRVESFLGFNFVKVEHLPTDGSGNRRIPVWHRSGIELGIGQDIRAHIDPEVATRRFNSLVYFSMMMGAIRTEDERVVEIKCNESAGIPA